MVLNADNTLPLLILADKYNVVDLRFVCIHFARLYIIPKLQLKEANPCSYTFAILYIITNHTARKNEYEICEIT